MTCPAPRSITHNGALALPFSLLLHMDLLAPRASSWGSLAPLVRSRQASTRLEKWGCGAEQSSAAAERAAVNCHDDRAVDITSGETRVLEGAANQAHVRAVNSLRDSLNVVWPGAGFWCRSAMTWRSAANKICSNPSPCPTAI